jgi:drug/metabolite transporter (DMT)-like permease
MLLALSAIWGSSFLFIKIGVRQLAPATLVAGRVGIALLVLAPVALLAVGPGPLGRALRAAWKPLLVVGLLNSTIPFWLLSWSEKRLDSGLAAILQASAPIFTAVLAARFDRSQRVTGPRLVGLVVGFLGVGMLVGVQPSGDLFAAFAVVGSALCYAVSVLVAGRKLRDTEPLVTALGTLAVATVAMLPVGIAQMPSEPVSAKTIASVLVLAVVCTAVAYILYFGIVKGAGASKAILVTYLVPAMAVFYGAVFLGEPVEATSLAGLALVLGGVALATGVVRPGALRAKARASTLRR